MFKKLRMDKKGMSLLELMVAVLIVAILAAIALPSYRSIIERTRIMNQFVIIKALQDAVVRYYAENDDFPTSFKSLPVGAPQDYAVSGLTMTKSDTSSAHEIKLNTAANSESITMTHTRNGSADWRLVFQFVKAQVPCSTTPCTSYRMTWGDRYFIIDTSDNNRKDLLIRVANATGWTLTGDKYKID